MKGSFTGAYRDKPGKLEIGAYGHDLPRRNRRDDAADAGSAAAVSRDRRAAEGRRRRRQPPRQRPGHRRDEPQPARSDRPGHSSAKTCYYRLNVIHIMVPPLRDRREDIPELVDHFLAHVTPRRTDRRLPACRPQRYEGAVGALVARQRARARERDRAAGRDGASGPDRARRSARPKSGLQDAIGFGLAASAGGPSPTISTSGSPRNASRSGRRCIRCSWSARSPAPTCAKWCGKGLEEARGNYKIVARLFNMESRDYKRFLNFLRKHDCQIPFKEYR